MIIQSKDDVVILRGVLAENHWPALKSVVSLLLKRHPAGVIIDGSLLSEVTESGAQTFLEASEYIQAQRARVMVAGLSDEIVREISGVPGIRSQLPRAATVGEARASLAISGADSLPADRRGPVVLVPLVGDWEKALAFSVGEVSRLRADIHLLYVLEVPRDQPLGIPLPEKEREAEQVLTEAEARVKSMGCRARRLSTRARRSIEGIARFAAESEPRLLVLAFPKAEFAAVDREQDIFGTLSRDSHCEAVVICGAEPIEHSAGPFQGSETLLVPLVGAWPGALEFAGVEASETRSEIDLLYVIQVPRAMALDEAMPEQEQEAARVFSEAEKGLKRFRVPVRRVLLRSRDVVDGIARHASATGPRMLITSYNRSQLAQGFTREAAVGALCRDVAVDAVIICPPA